MHNKEEAKSLGTVNTFPDQAVACPICNQEFWGYSKIIFCSCGWTFVQEEETPKVTLKTLKEPSFIENYGKEHLQKNGNHHKEISQPIIIAKPDRN